MYGMVQEEGDSNVFVSDLSNDDENVTNIKEELIALSIDDFGLGDMAALGMTISGSGIIVSLLVLGILSILRTR